MSHDDAPKKKKKRHFSKTLRKFLATLGALVALLAVALLCLPLALSSNFARAKIVQALTEATGKPASLQRLDFSWGGGLRLDDLRIGQGGPADPEFLCTLERLHAEAGLLALLRGRAVLTLEVQGLRLHLVIPKKPPEPSKPLPQILRQTFAILRTGLSPIALPLDATIRVDLTDAEVRLALPGASAPLDLRNLRFRLDAPSIKNAPITCLAALDPAVGGKPLEPVRLDVKLTDLCDSSGRIDAARARLDFELTAPGASAALHGDLADGVKAELRADLGACATAYGQLAEGLPDASGKLALSLSLGRPAQDRVNAALVIFADALRAAGGPLGAKAFGPLSLSLLQEADFDCAAETLALPGSLDMAGRTQVRWQARVDGLRDGRPQLAAEVKPLDLDLTPLLAAARAFLPPGLGVGSAGVRAESLNATVQLPETTDVKPQIAAQVRKLVLEAARISRRDASGALGLERAQFAVDAAEATLPGAAPGALTLRAAASASGLSLEGATPVALAGAEVKRLNVRAERIVPDKAALFGLTATADVELDAEARGLEAKGKAAAPALSERLRLRAELPAGKSADVRLDALEVAAPKILVTTPGKPATETPFSLRVTAPEIRLTRPAEGAPLAPAVRDALIGLDLGGALHSSARLSLSGPSSRDVVSDGTVTLDARRLLALTAAFAPRDVKASGALSAEWKLAAALPQRAKPQAAAPRTIAQRLKELNFLRQAEAELTLKDLSLDWPLAPQPGKRAEILRLRGLSTPKPLRLSTKNGAQESSLSGALAFGPLEALPGLGALDRPLRGLVSIDAKQQGGRSAQVAESLRLDGHDLEQSLTLVLDKLDLVLDREDKPAAALEHLDATLGFRLAGALQALPARHGKAAAIGGSGRVEAGADIRLSGGRSLTVAARLLSPGLDLRLGPDLRLSGLKSSLRFQRRFGIAKGLICPGDAEPDLTPLSEQVFNQFPATAPTRPDGRSLAGLLAPDADRQGLGVLSLSRAQLKAGPLPLDLRDVEIKVDTASAVPGLRSFRAGLLGGSVLGGANLRKTAGRYSLEADMAFTGVDPGRLFPAKAARDLGDRAETSGRLSLSVPLTPDPETLLQRLSLRADITKIGPRTLERMLYALDPEEQNETIVQQRRLMAMGYPRWLRAAIAYGNLSLTGAVEVKGFQLDLPPVDRLNIANLPIRDKLSKPLAAVPDLIRALDAASGNVICRDRGKALRVAQPAASKE
jgi:hypothetical protein